MINHRNLGEFVRPGAVLEIASPWLDTLAEVVQSRGDRLVARPDRPVTEAGRVLVRTPMVGALLQTSARLSLLGEDGAARVLLSDFANIRQMERRAYIRLEEPVRVSVLAATDGRPRVLPAINVSGRGLLLGWPGPPDVALGERLRLLLSLDGTEVRAEGEVVRVDRSRAALRFTAIAEDDQARILGYVFRRDHRKDPLRGRAYPATSADADEEVF